MEVGSGPGRVVPDFALGRDAGACCAGCARSRGFSANTIYFCLLKPELTQPLRGMYIPEFCLSLIYQSNQHFPRSADHYSQQAPRFAPGDGISTPRLVYSGVLDL